LLAELFRRQARFRALFIVREPLECFQSNYLWAEQFTVGRGLSLQRCLEMAVQSGESSEEQKFCRQLRDHCTATSARTLNSDPSSQNRLAVVQLRAISDVNGYNRIAEFLGVQHFPAGFAPSRENTVNKGLDCVALNVSCEWIVSQSACKRGPGRQGEAHRWGRRRGPRRARRHPHQRCH
jgi:hypothetical protein